MPTKKKVAKNETPYWTQAIALAKKRKKQGLVPFQDHIVCKAGDWTVCACGKQSPLFFNGHDKELGPDDVKLYELGIEFADIVYNQNPVEAERVLSQIEKRATFLLPLLRQKKALERKRDALEERECAIQDELDSIEQKLYCE